MKTTLILLLIAFSCRAQNGLKRNVDTVYFSDTPTIKNDTFRFMDFTMPMPKTTWDTILVQFLVSDKGSAPFIQFGKEVRYKEDERYYRYENPPYWIHYKYLNIDTTLTLWGVKEWK